MKIIKQTFLSILIMLFLSGCVNCNIDMTIKKNKSMNLSFKYETDNEYTFLTDNDIKPLIDNGFEYHNNDSIKELIKKYHNIDKLSNNSLKQVDFEEILFTNNDIFNIQKGFLKNKYSVNINKTVNQKQGDDLALNLDGNKIKVYLFISEGCNQCHLMEEYLSSLFNSEVSNMFEFVKISVYDVNWNVNQSNKLIMDEVAKIKSEKIIGVPYLVIGSNYSLVGYHEDYNEEIKNVIMEEYNNDNYSDLVQNVIDGKDVDTTTDRAEENDNLKIDESSFLLTINLPYGALSNNADTVSADHKQLSWNLNDLEKDTIEFSFELYNFEYLYIGVGISIILIIIIALNIKKLKNTYSKQSINPKKNKEVITS